MNDICRISDDGNYFSWWCSGCKHGHAVPITGARGWTFSGSTSSPTLAPSVLNTKSDPQTNEVKHTCHIFLRNGKVEFLSDCTHDLAGKTIPLEPQPLDEDDTI